LVLTKISYLSHVVHRASYRYCRFNNVQDNLFLVYVIVFATQATLPLLLQGWSD